MITITQRHNEARLQGSLDDLNRGAGNPAVRVYGGVRPAQASGVPTSAMLVEIPLTKPAGVIANGVLTLTQDVNGLIANTGVATWARFVDGDGETCFDADAGEGDGPWEVQLAKEQLYAGGEARIVSAILG